MPDRTFTIVDLPAPLSPTSATTSARRTSKSTWSSACTAPNRLETPRSSRSGAPATTVIRAPPPSPSEGEGRGGGEPSSSIPSSWRRTPEAPAAPSVECSYALRDARRFARVGVLARADLVLGPEAVLDHGRRDRALDDGLRCQQDGRHVGGTVVRL